MSFRAAFVPEECSGLGSADAINLLVGSAPLSGMLELEKVTSRQNRMLVMFRTMVRKARLQRGTTNTRLS